MNKDIQFIVRSRKHSELNRESAYRLQPRAQIDRYIIDLSTPCMCRQPRVADASPVRSPGDKKAALMKFH